MSDNTIRGGLWFSLHRWASLPIWILLFFICVTGTISVVSHEITWLVDPMTRAFNPDDRPRLSYGKIATTITREWPDAHVQFIVDRASYTATQVGIALPDAPSATAHVNQYSGEVQGLTRGVTFPDFMRSLHGWLLVPWTSGTSWGYYLVGFLALPLLCSLITALIVDKYFWRAFYRPRIRTKQSSRIFWSDLHRVIGVWSIPFVAIIALTGLWYLAQGSLWDLEIFIDSPAPMIGRETLPIVPSDEPARVDLDQMLATARAAIPDFDVKWISLPETAYHHTEVYGLGRFPVLSDFAVVAYINPYTGELAATRDIEDLTTIQWIDQMADPLHYGDFGGLWSKAIWFVFGLVLSLMIFSGMLVWLKRTARAIGWARRPAVGNTAAIESK